MSMACTTSFANSSGSPAFNSSSLMFLEGPDWLGRRCHKWRLYMETISAKLSVPHFVVSAASNIF